MSRNFSLPQNGQEKMRDVGESKLALGLKKSPIYIHQSTVWVAGHLLFM